MLDDAAYACGSVRDAFVERLRVRYAECDGQGHVVNAHYLTFCDPALDRMLCTRAGDFKAMGWEFMLVRSVIDRQASARDADLLEVAVEGVRLGRSSFDMRLTGTVEQRSIFTAVNAYVGVARGTRTPIPPPRGREIAARALQPVDLGGITPDRSRTAPSNTWHPAPS